VVTHHQFNLFGHELSRRLRRTPLERGTFIVIEEGPVSRILSNQLRNPIRITGIEAAKDYADRNAMENSRVYGVYQIEQQGKYPPRVEETLGAISRRVYLTQEHI
jgi:hypothetical protein